MNNGRTLVLSVDRDDDIGYKAGIESPVVGRSACLDTAIRLGIVDPEDSDTNAIFQAIKTYDELVKKGEDVEIAVIGGHHLNMLEGDSRIADILSKLIQSTGVVNCILISDGAEDEFIIPIIQSQLKIVGVVRVIINQLPNIEGTYYIIKKVLNDPKVARTVLVPSGLAMILYVLASILSQGIPAYLVVVGMIGFYLLFKGFDLDEYMVLTYHQLTDSLHRSKISIVAYIFATIFIFGGVSSGLMSVITYYPIYGDGGFVYHCMTFLFGSIIWLMIAGLLISAGRIANTLQNEWRRVSRVIFLPFFVVAISLISYGYVIYFLSTSSIGSYLITSIEGTIAVITMTLMGIIVTSIGIYYRSRIQKWMLRLMDEKIQENSETEKYFESNVPRYKKIRH